MRRPRNAKAAFVIMETVDDAKWIVEHVNGGSTVVVRFV